MYCACSSTSSSTHPTRFPFTARIAVPSLPLSLQTEFCRRETNKTERITKDSTIHVHLFLRATHCNGKLQILHTSLLRNHFKLSQRKSTHRHYFKVVVLFNVKSWEAFTSLHFLLAERVPTSSFRNSPTTTQEHVTPAPIQTIRMKAPFKQKYAHFNLDQLLPFLPGQRQRKLG